jgi:hypothetical protein
VLHDCVIILNINLNILYYIIVKKNLAKMEKIENNELAQYRKSLKMMEKLDNKVHTICIHSIIPYI